MYTQEETGSGERRWIGRDCSSHPNACAADILRGGPSQRGKQRQLNEPLIVPPEAHLIPRHVKTHQTTRGLKPPP